MNQPTGAAAHPFPLTRTRTRTHGLAAPGLAPTPVTGPAPSGSASVSPRTALALFVLALSTLLPGCGGSDDTSVAASPGAPAPAPVPAPAPAPVPAPSPVPVPPPPAPVASTTLEGAVVKGPVAGAAVCAYTVVASGRGAALGSCTTSDATGAYTLTVPAGSGALWVEATGGSYTDEATGATATLPPGSPLRTLTTATGGTVRSVVTPLTTLALNDALARLAAGSTLDGAAFAAAATRLLATFGLPAGLAIGTATPAFGTGIDSYGTALTVVSRMVAAGTPLATLLATVDPATLAAAYAAAAAPPAPPPPPVVPGAASVALAFSAVGGVGPVDTAAFDASNSTLIQAYEFGVGTVNEFLTIIVNTSVTGSTDPNRSRRFVVQFRTVAPAVGATFTPPVGTNAVGVQFYQFEDNLVPTPTGRLYNGAGGTVTVVARTASSITVRLSGVTLSPGALFKGLPTTGSFVVNGDITAPIQK